MESLEQWLTRPEGVATRLRGLRAQARLSGKDLADTNGWAQSKVSRIENGLQMPSAGDIEAWCRACRADGAITDELLRAQEEAQVVNATFRNRVRRGQAEVQDSYGDLVRQSHVVRHFETVFVPGLLQIPDYARAILTEMRELHDLDVDDVDAAVASRMQRQQMLWDPQKRFEFLLGEPVLRWLVVPAGIMRAQLDRLQTVIGLDRIRFGILPLHHRLRTTPQNSVQIYAGDNPVAAVETFIGETFHRGEQADLYGQALDKMWNDAVTGDDARQLIQAAITGLEP